MLARTPALLAALLALSTAACDEDLELAVPDTIQVRNGTGGSGPVFNTNVLLNTDVPAIDTTGQPLGGVSLLHVDVLVGGSWVPIDPGTLHVTNGTLAGTAGDVTYTGTDFINSGWTFDVGGQIVKAKLTGVETSLAAGLWDPHTSMMIRNLDPDRLVYTFRYKHTQTKQELTTCAEDAVGGARMVMYGDIEADHVFGDIRSQPDRIYFGCISGALGKAALWGYAPDSPSQPSLSIEEFETMTRIVRSDYCADGKAHTQVGKLLTLEDRWQINDHGSFQYKTEAIWEVGGGAKCLRRIRSSGKVLALPFTCNDGTEIPLCPLDETDAQDLWDSPYGDVWTRIP